MCLNRSSSMLRILDNHQQRGKVLSKVANRKLTNCRTRPELHTLICTGREVELRRSPKTQTVEGRGEYFILGSYWELFINWRSVICASAEGRMVLTLSKTPRTHYKALHIWSECCSQPPVLCWYICGLLLFPRELMGFMVWRRVLRHPDSLLLPHHFCSQLHVVSTYECSATFDPRRFDLWPPSLVSHLAPLSKSHRGFTHPSHPSYWLQLAHLMFNVCFLHFAPGFFGFWLSWLIYGDLGAAFLLQDNIYKITKICSFDTICVRLRDAWQEAASICGGVRERF